VRFCFPVSASHKIAFCELLRSSSILIPFPLRRRLKRKSPEAILDERPTMRWFFGGVAERERVDIYGNLCVKRKGGAVF